MPEAVLQAAAGVVETQLALCSIIDSEQFGGFASGDYSGGYSIGQFDAALPKAGVHVKDQEHFFCLMGDGFAYLLGCTKMEGRQVAKAFMGREGSDEMAGAQSRGGTEFSGLLDG